MASKTSRHSEKSEMSSQIFSCKSRALSQLLHATQIGPLTF